MDKRIEKIRCRDPATGQYIEMDKVKAIGYQSHGNSYWKLYDRFNRKIGTITEDGKWIRK